MLRARTRPGWMVGPLTAFQFKRKSCAPSEKLEFPCPAEFYNIRLRFRLLTNSTIAVNPVPQQASRPSSCHHACQGGWVSFPLGFGPPTQSSPKPACDPSAFDPSMNQNLVALTLGPGCRFSSRRRQRLFDAKRSHCPFEPVSSESKRV